MRPDSALRPVPVVTVRDLPAPPHGRQGWPWTVDGPPLPATRPDGGAWPRVSVVTPSRDQARFLEETIRSILLQGYPDLEYVVVDGGSTDGSVEIMRRYEPWLSRWSSEPDRGQAHAINRGLRGATGEIWNWINSDDVLMPGVLRRVAAAFGAGDAVAGNIHEFGDGFPDRVIAPRRLEEPARILTGRGATFVQPSVWLRREHVVTQGGCDERFRNAFDWDLLLRYFLRHPRVVYVDETLVRYRLHPASKTVSQPPIFLAEQTAIIAGLLSDPTCAVLHRACLRALRQRYWSYLLIDLAEDLDRSRWRRAAAIAAAAWLDPAVRLNRFTAGRVRRLCLGA